MNEAALWQNVSMHAEKVLVTDTPANLVKIIWYTRRSDDYLKKHPVKQKRPILKINSYNCPLVKKVRKSVKNNDLVYAVYLVIAFVKDGIAVMTQYALP